MISGKFLFLYLQPDSDFILICVMNASNTAPPNILLISTDHWPANLLGCAGHPGVITPTLDQIARNGIRFANATSECPVCVPARKTLMTGIHPSVHGQKDNAHRPFPQVTPMAQAFRDAGYQAYGVGKLHLENQRSRVGFDDVWVDEEGRAGEGIGQDDYELFLGDHGFAGQRFAGGMNSNDYMWRPWHLPERFHVTNWAATSMSRMIKRRDPTKPGFWYLSFSHPHPPLAPLQAYLDVYRGLEIPEPHVGDWARLDEHTPVRVRERILQKTRYNSVQTREIRRAFYALCTHIDHQIRVVLGTLREEGELKNTVIMFMSDHGDCLGNHQQWAKDQMINDSCNIPLILSGVPVMTRTGCGQVSDRLVGLSDVFPTLCDAAGIACPDHVTGTSMLADTEPEDLYGLWGYGEKATRMVRDKRYKLIYFPRGNDFLLFDLQEDPRECCNVASDPKFKEVRDRLLARLLAQLDSQERQDWMKEGQLIGLPAGELPGELANFAFSGQRGQHWPPPSNPITGW